MYAQYAQCGIRHDIQNPPLNCRQCANLIEDVVAEDQPESLYGNTSSSSGPPEVAEKWEANGDDAGYEGDNNIDDIRESSDSSIDEDDKDGKDDKNEDEPDSSDVYYFSF